jgi:hypothetical protein
MFTLFQLTFCFIGLGLISILKAYSQGVAANREFEKIENDSTRDYDEIEKSKEKIQTMAGNAWSFLSLAYLFFDISQAIAYMIFVLWVTTYWYVMMTLPWPGFIIHSYPTEKCMLVRAFSGILLTITVILCIVDQ